MMGIADGVVKGCVGSVSGKAGISESAEVVGNCSMVTVNVGDL